MQLIALDFETYYDNDFSLSKLTTEEYIRDSRFEIIGVAVKIEDKKPEWYSGSSSDIRYWLRQFNWGDAMLVAHNAMFDAAILSWVCGIKPKALGDTLSMARALHGTKVGGSLKALAEQYSIGVKGTEVVNAKGKHREDFAVEELARYAEYCCNDTELAHRLFKCLSPSFGYVELKLIDLTLRMFTEPKLLLDKGILVGHLKSIQENKARLMDDVAANKFQLMSNPQFAACLAGLGVTPPRKISPTTGKETWAFAKSDDGFKALLIHENSAVQALVAARLGVKSTLEETRTQRFLDISERGLMPVPLRYYAAHTGRWGGADKVNLHNLPRKSPLKNAIIPPTGYVMIDSDSSQIEARTLAWLAGQNDLVEAFANGEDVYKIMASAIYNKAAEDITATERFVGKTTILGCGYGMGANKFKAQLAVFGVVMEIEECERIITAYRGTYPCIPLLWKQSQKAISAMMLNSLVELGLPGVLSVEGKAGIKLPNNLYLQYPQLRYVTNEEGHAEYVYDTKRGKQVIPTRVYGGKLVENICQALARCVIGSQLIAVSERYRPVLTVHDAISCIARKEEAEEAKAYVEKCMRCAPDWAAGLPLNCEVGVGRSYGEC